MFKLYRQFLTDEFRELILDAWEREGTALDLLDEHSHVITMQVRLRTGNVISTYPIGTYPEALRQDIVCLKSILIDKMIEMDNEV